MKRMSEWPTHVRDMGMLHDHCTEPGEPWIYLVAVPFSTLKCRQIKLWKRGTWKNNDYNNNNNKTLPEMKNKKNTTEKHWWKTPEKKYIYINVFFPVFLLPFVFFRLFLFVSHLCPVFICLFFFVPVLSVCSFVLFVLHPLFKHFFQGRLLMTKLYEIWTIFENWSRNWRKKGYKMRSTNTVYTTNKNSSYQPSSFDRSGTLLLFGCLWPLDLFRIREAPCETDHAWGMAEKLTT